MKDINALTISLSSILNIAFEENVAAFYIRNYVLAGSHICQCHKKGLIQITEIYSVGDILVLSEPR